VFTDFSTCLNAQTYFFKGAAACLFVTTTATTITTIKQLPLPFATLHHFLPSWQLRKLLNVKRHIHFHLDIYNPQFSSSSPYFQAAVTHSLKLICAFHFAIKIEIQSFDFPFPPILDNVERLSHLSDCNWHFESWKAKVRY